MTERRMRAMHSAFVQGSRLAEVRAGERAYQAWRKRVQRSRVTS